MERGKKRGGFAVWRNLGSVLAFNALVLMAIASCQAPAVSARAVWIDVRRGPEGERTLHTYDRGEISRRSIAPLHIDVPIFSMALGSQGSYLLIRGTDTMGTVLDMASGRSLPVYLPSQLGANDNFLRFTARGDALAWLDDYRRINLIPLSPAIKTDQDLNGGIRAVQISEPADSTNSSNQQNKLIKPWSWFASAANAPRVVGYRTTDRSLYAVSYPDEQSVEMHGSTAGMNFDVARVESPDSLVSRPRKQQNCTMANFKDCRSNFSIDPFGNAITVAIANEASNSSGDEDEEDDDAIPQEWMRWKIGSKTSSPKKLNIPEELRKTGAQLLSQLDANTYVFVDELLIRRWDRSSGEIVSLPRPTEDSEQSTVSSYWQEVDEGRRLLWLNLNGRMLLIDREQMTLVNIETTPCIEPSSPVVSPNGRFAAWTCEPSDLDEQTPQSLSSKVLRVSASGLEIYRGISMSVLAVDDNGNLLMNSETSRLESEEEIDEYENLPRILYVLTSDGLLFEVDNLEPSPEKIQNVETERTSFMLVRSYR